jgi:hypothetical protein
MNEMIHIEGDTLEDAVLAAAGALGVERDAVEFKYDRDHLAAGANTVKIFASKKSPEAIAAARAAAAAAPPPSTDAPRRDDRRDDGRGRFRDDRPRGGGRGGPGGGRGPDRGRDGPRDDRPRGPRVRDPELDKERDEALKARAREVVATVVASGTAAVMPNLNSFERHLVHTIVAEAGLASISIGEGLRKDVQISVKEGSSS